MTSGETCFVNCELGLSVPFSCKYSILWIHVVIYHFSLNSWVLKQFLSVGRSYILFLFLNWGFTCPSFLLPLKFLFLHVGLTARLGVMRMEGTQAEVIFRGTEQGALKSVVYIREESWPLGDSEAVKVDSRVYRAPRCSLSTFVPCSGGRILMVSGLPDLADSEILQKHAIRWLDSSIYRLFFFPFYFRWSSSNRGWHPGDIPLPRPSPLSSAWCPDVSHRRKSRGGAFRAPARARLTSASHLPRTCPGGDAGVGLGASAARAPSSRRPDAWEQCSALGLRLGIRKVRHFPSIYYLVSWFFFLFSPIFKCFFSSR